VLECGVAIRNCFPEVVVDPLRLSYSLAALIDSLEQIRNSINQIERLGTHGIQFSSLESQRDAQKVRFRGVLGFPNQ
jgi:hypothetical protein